jgi:signal peptidase I
MMFFRWLSSQTVRNAFTLRKHVRRLVAAQRDILPAPARANLERALAEFDTALHSGIKADALMAEMQKLEQAANKWITPYPNANWRENVEVILVAVSVAMAIRTFILQPFKIPTGSMQPTLFGVTSKNLMDDKNFVIPTGWERVKEWFEGVSYIHVVAAADGKLEPTEQNTLNYGRVQVVEAPHKILIFNLCQSLKLGGMTQTIWLPPDLGEAPLEYRTNLDPDHYYHKGDDVIKLRVSAGDHLFVDRVSYNFRKPKRGEIVVFETHGINSLPQDEFYIKRLTVMPGERVQIGDDRHLIINGHRLDRTTPHFEHVYDFNPATPPDQSIFCGHLNGTVAQKYHQYSDLPYFPDQETIYTNGPNTYMVMGDNTCNSSDSRVWGSFPTGNVIGKYFFVYWPFTGRFGWGNR